MFWWAYPNSMMEKTTLIITALDQWALLYKLKWPSQEQVMHLSQDWANRRQTWYLIAENQQKDMMEDQIKKAPYLQFYISKIKLQEGVTILPVILGRDAHSHSVFGNWIQNRAMVPRQ